MNAGFALELGGGDRGGSDLPAGGDLGGGLKLAADGAVERVLLDHSGEANALSDDVPCWSTDRIEGVGGYG